MGLFKSINEATKLAGEIRDDYDPKAQRAAGMERMRQAQAMMAQQTAAATAAVSGLDGTATVVTASQGSGMINMQPIVDIELTVLVPGRMPYPVKVSTPMDITTIARLAPGASVRVKVDPENRENVWIDPVNAA